MIRHFTLILLVFCLVACNLDNNSRKFTIGQSDPSPSELYERDTLPNGSVILRPSYSLTKFDSGSIRLDFFDTIPETISKPAEFYTYDTTPLISGKYIFLTDLVTYAILKIRGKDIYLKKEIEQCRALSEDTFKDVFAGNSYSVIFIHKNLNHKNGTPYATGSLDIKNSKYQVLIKIHGGYKF